MNIATPTSLSRRSLLAGGAALAAVAPGLKVSFAAEATTPRDILVVLFQRGACDWLQMLAPAGDSNYVAARPTIRIRTDGNTPGIGVGTLGGTDMYLPAVAPELKTLYDSGKLAFIHAVGIPTTDRSHFTCQDMMEKGGADGEPEGNAGWLARHVASAGTGGAELSTVASSATNPVSLLGEATAIAIANTDTFNINGGNGNASVIRAINSGPTSAYKAIANAALDAVDDVQAGLRTLTDNSSEAGYTNGALSQSLRSLGKLIKMNVGIDIATVDYGGWDMHNSLTGEFNTRTTEFSRAINAFWKDIAAYQNRVTLITMTEFGRRLQENASQGTDHGSAGGMMVLSGNVKGGKIYGTWPGLAANQLVTGDLRVTTDYRQVLAEILVTRHRETKLSTVFPTISYSPLGFMNA